LCTRLISVEPLFTVSLVQNGLGAIDFGVIGKPSDIGIPIWKSLMETDSTKYTGSIAYTPMITIAEYENAWTIYWSVRFGVHQIQKHVLID